ncbi:MAG: hypothetical protein ACRDY6_19470 [Acidimicrobiia bacterium]
MARTTRLCGVACVGTAVLAVVALVGFVAVVGSDPIADAAGDAAFYVPASAAFGSAVLLGLGLVGLYLRQEERFGAFGAIGFVIALLGTIAAAGGQWTYVFVVPHFAPAVPEMINESTGSVLAGFVLSYAVLALGWILFGLATLRAGIFPRWASLLVVAGAAIAFLPLPSRTLILAIAVAILGLRLLRNAAVAERRTANAPAFVR